MNGNRGFRSEMSPVNVGDELDVKIETVGKKGDGIAKREGFVLFVPNTKEGDEVKIRVTRVLRNVGFAEVVGQAESKSEETTDEPVPQEAEQEQPNKEAADEKPEEAEAQDTEDFGEDLEEKK